MKKLFIIFSCVVLLDQVTKWWAQHAGWVTLNSGISFGMGERLPAVGVTLLVCIVFAMLLYAGRPHWVRFPIANGFFLGGVVSNVLDRLVSGGVRDWLPLPGTGLQNNLADWAIGIGVFLFCLQLFTEKNSSKY